jgi:uncharacterized protein YmfQ (DUF2313 family)
VFKRFSQTIQANALAAWLPNDKYVFSDKNVVGSDLRNLIEGLAQVFVDAKGQIVTFQDNYDINKTELFISDWENSVGIPDQCFDGSGDIETRRLHVLVKLASLGVQTAQDFIALASLFGITVTITSGNPNGIFPMTFPILFFDNATAARFTIVVNFTVDAGSRFPYTFPLPFGDENIALLECLFSRLNPENTQVIFNQV